MNDVRPLLAFPPSSKGPIPAGPPQFSPPPHRPSATRQGERLRPQFSALQSAFDSARVTANSETAEADPELVVVFDVVGSIDRFARAASQVEGLEFLAEFIDEDGDPDEDFYIEDQGIPTDSMLPESLYLVMSNARAVSELIRLFDLWQRDPTAQFPRGLAPLKNAFTMLRSLRRWGPEDRIRETGLLQAWLEEVEVVGPHGSVRVEIELWYRDNAGQRASAEAQVEKLIQGSNGTVISTSVIPAIDYHAILADLPHNQVQLVLNDGPEAIELLKTNSVMFMSPARPMSVPALELGEDLPVQEEPPAPRPTTAPRVALLDGLPLANHQALSGRLIVDDPDNCGENYVADRQHHGTAMASLICHGDLEAPGPPLSTPLYVRPIMEPHPFFQSEVVLQDQLMVDLIHRAFRRMFEGDNHQEPAAPSVRIVNLSIGDPTRIFTRRMSPAAKMLDWLTWKYNVLVLVSAGNHSSHHGIADPQVPSDIEVRRLLLQNTYSSARLRRLFSPAEAINALTVGATHDDSHTAQLPESVLDPSESGLPARYSALGFGYRRSIKPEILLPGGRKLLQRPISVASAPLEFREARHSATGPGLKVAAPDASGGPRGTAYSAGTSNATALATRAANQVFDVLDELRKGSEAGVAFPDPQYDPVLTKALLVHAANWGDTAARLRDALDLNGSGVRKTLTQLLGYGPIEFARLGAGARTRAALLGAGSIGQDQRETFHFPLPTALAATADWRRLTVTLAWLSPVNVRTQAHRMARLRVHPNEDFIGVRRVEADHNAVRRGTVQHEVLEGRDALAFVQGDTLTLQVDCRIDAGQIDAPIRFGLVASVEMASTVRADIHLQVQEQLRVQAQQRQQLRAR